MRPRQLWRIPLPPSISAARRRPLAVAGRILDPALGDWLRRRFPRDAGAGAPPSSRASDVVGSGAIGDRFLHVGARRRRQRSTTALWSSNFYHVARRRTAVHAY